MTLEPLESAGDEVGRHAYVVGGAAVDLGRTVDVRAARPRTGVNRKAVRRAVRESSPPPLRRSKPLLDNARC